MLNFDAEDIDVVLRNVGSSATALRDARRKNRDFFLLMGIEEPRSPEAVRLPNCTIFHAGKNIPGCATVNKMAAMATILYAVSSVYSG